MDFTTVRTLFKQIFNRHGSSENRGTSGLTQTRNQSYSLKKKKKKRNEGNNFPPEPLDAFSSELSSREDQAKDEIRGLRRQISDLKKEVAFYKLREEDRTRASSGSFESNEISTVNSLKRENEAYKRHVAWLKLELHERSHAEEREQQLRKKLAAFERERNESQAQNEHLNEVAQDLFIQSEILENQKIALERATYELNNKAAEIERDSLALQLQGQQMEREAQEVQQHLQFQGQFLMAKERELFALYEFQATHATNCDVFAGPGETNLDQVEDMEIEFSSEEWQDQTENTAEVLTKTGCDAIPPKQRRKVNSCEENRTENTAEVLTKTGRDAIPPEQHRMMNPCEENLTENTETDLTKTDSDSSLPERRTSDLNRKLIVDRRFHGKIVGTGGKNINYLKKKYKVTIDVPPRNSHSKVIELSGAPSDVLRVVKELEKSGVMIEGFF